MELLSHLYNHYTRISSALYGARSLLSFAAISVEDPLNSLIERLNECADFVTAGTKPVSETHMVRIAYVLVAEIYQYPED